MEKVKNLEIAIISGVSIIAPCLIYSQSIASLKFLLTHN